MKNVKKFVLASESLRRREILSSLGIKYETRPADIDETIPCEYINDPEKAAMYLSARKAEAVFSGNEYEIIIAADTVVFIDGEILGKPSDADDAFRMLSKLSGKSHSVVTGITVLHENTMVTEFEKSFVRFAELSERQIKKYIKLKNPLDKAGAYGIQEAACLFVSGIEGDYLNIVGLPVYRLGAILRKNFNIELMDEIESTPEMI